MKALLVMLLFAAQPVFAASFLTFGRSGDIATGLNLQLNGLSNDGSTVFGLAGSQGFLWNATRGFQTLPGEALYSSHSGNVIAGSNYVWRNGVTTPLPFTVAGVSANGSTLIGSDANGGLRWDGAAHRLGFTPLAVSGNGSVIAGAKGPSIIDGNVVQTGRGTLVKWDGAEQELGKLQYETFNVLSLHISHDGAAIVGTTVVMHGSLAFTAFVHDMNGLVQVDSLSTAKAISGNGRFIYGLDRQDPRSIDLTRPSELGTVGGLQADSSFNGEIVVHVPGASSPPRYWDETLGDIPLVDAMHAKGVPIEVELPDLALGSGGTALVSDDGTIFASDARPNRDPRYDYSFWLADVNAIPEPTVYVMLACGLLGASLALKKRGRQSPRT